MQVDDGKGMFRGSNGSGAQPHSESVKRHLDGYDVEASLNEVWSILLLLSFFCMDFANMNFGLDLRR